MKTGDDLLRMLALDPVVIGEEFSLYETVVVNIPNCYIAYCRFHCYMDGGMNEYMRFTKPGAIVTLNYFISVIDDMQALYALADEAAREVV